MEKLILIDGNSLINRAFYATPVFTTKNGLPTNGVFGFIKLMLKIISDKKPTYFAVAFDLHAPTFRHKMYQDYKAGRKPMPEELAVQIPVLKEMLSLMHVKTCELAGFEADDLIGTIAKKFDTKTYIYTGDRDAYQLVDKTTSVCFTRKGVSDILELTAENFKDETNLTPAQIIDLKALMGDKSDHIPGVAGVGEKSAMSLIEKYGDLNGIYEHLDEISGALHKKLLDGKEDAYFSYKLATIDTNAPIELSLADCVLKMPFDHAVREKFAELEFKSLFSLNIFSEENAAQNSTSEQKHGKIEEVYPETVEQALEIVENSTASRIACDLTDKEFRFTLLPDGWTPSQDAVEYVLPIKIGLLDPGFFEYQLESLFKSVYSGQKRVISYNVKETLHHLHSSGLSLPNAFDDVSILKCIAEGLSNTDGLQYALNSHQLPERNKSYGVAALYENYFHSLSDNEKKLYQDVELPLVRVLFDMELQGVCIDEQALGALAVRYNAEREEITKRIYELAGETFNINSTQQLGKVLFDKLKIGSGVKKNKESKSYKTTAEELEKYADSSEIVRQILRYRTVQKLYSTYIEGFKPLIVGGKVHTTYNQSNTATGRLSSMNPNLQNIPIKTEEGRELRKLFTASKGNVLIDADYSQIELRLLAHFSASKELIEAYIKGRDIHATTASQVFDVPLDKVNAEQRRQAKAVNFGIIYGISAFGLSKDLNISAKRAQEYIDKYFEFYSGVKGYMQGNVDTVAKHGEVKTLLGRRRVINEARSANRNVRMFGERAAMNMPLQGSSADIIKLAMIGVYEKLKAGNYKAKLVLQVHDELVIDCPKNEAEEVAKLLKSEMENAASLRVPLTVEVGIGENWFESK